ncbi:MAG: hypothetical protein NVSMB65_05700 [Chloroflexota bacterium]
MLGVENAVGRATTLLIVDGHEGVRMALARRLHFVPGVAAVWAAGTLDAAARLAAERHPGVIVCDPRTLPGSAVAVVHLLAATGAAVVVHTSSLDEGEAAALAGAGACAIVLKGSAFTTLVESIEHARAAWDRAAAAQRVR